METNTQAVRWAIENDKAGVIRQIADRQAENMLLLSKEEIAVMLAGGLPSLNDMTDNQLVCEWLMTFDEGGR